MDILPVSPENIALAVECIRTGGIVGHATETCYGFTCDVQNVRAVELLFTIKHRPEQQPISILFQNLIQAKQYVLWNANADTLSETYLPGPITLVLSANPATPKPFLTIPHPLKGVAQTIGVRISSHPVAQAIVEAFGAPVATTSANLHGQPNTYSAQDIQKQFLGLHILPDVILDSGTLPKAPPSTVVDCTAQDYKILRMGNTEISKE